MFDLAAKCREISFSPASPRRAVVWEGRTTHFCVHSTHFEFMVGVAGRGTGRNTWRQAAGQTACFWS